MAKGDRTADEVKSLKREKALLEERSKIDRRRQRDDARDAEAYRKRLIPMTPGNLRIGLEDMLMEMSSVQKKAEVFISMLKEWSTEAKKKNMVRETPWKATHVLIVTHASCDPDKIHVMRDVDDGCTSEGGYYTETEWVTGSGGGAAVTFDSKGVYFASGKLDVVALEGNAAPEHFEN